MNNSNDDYIPSFPPHIAAAHAHAATPKGLRLKSTVSEPITGSVSRKIQQSTTRTTKTKNAAATGQQQEDDEEEEVRFDLEDEPGVRRRPPPQISSPSPFRTHGRYHNNVHLLTIQRTRSLDEQALSESGGRGGSSSGRKGRGQHEHDAYVVDHSRSGQKHHTQRFLFGEEFVDDGIHQQEFIVDDDGDSNNNAHISSSSSAALHSSFDASMFRGEGIGLRGDNNKEEGREVNMNELSGRKHYLRPRTPVDSSPDATTKPPPRTVRKKDYRLDNPKAAPNTRQEDNNAPMVDQLDNQTSNDVASSSGSLFLTTQTPGRARPRRLSTTPKPTHGTTVPSSATKRRRAPTSYRPRQSPMRRVPPNTPVPKNVKNQPTSLSSSSRTPNPFMTNATAAAYAHDSNWDQNCLLWSDEDQSRKSMSTAFAMKTPAQRFYDQQECGTAPTAHLSSQFETTFDTAEETNSVDTTSSPARFRFSSFPASLPRVNNLRNSVAHSGTGNMDGSTYPDSVRKHMTFSELAEQNESDVAGLGSSAASDTNQSREDDGTQNTSISSLSADGGGGGHHKHLPDVPGQKYSSSSSLFRSEDIPTSKFFADDDNDNNEDIDSQEDNACQSHLVFTEQKDIIGDLNNVLYDTHNSKKSVLDPSKSTSHHPMDMNVDLSRPYENHKRINSFPSSLSSNTQMNISDDVPSLSPPGRSGLLGPGGVGANYEVGTDPDTPREVQLHFPLEAECSPILNLKDPQDAHVRPAISSSTAAAPTQDRNDGSSTSSSPLMGDGLLLPTKMSAASSSTSSLGNHSSKKAQSLKRDEGSLGSDFTQQRSLRPMPDMSAFESVLPHSRDRSRDDSTADSRGAGSTQRRICPPTPQRTPAYFSSRSNSLVSTKVLLAAPSQVLEGRSSLENSVLDDDTDTSTIKGIAPNKAGTQRTQGMTLRSQNKLRTSDDDMDIDDERGSHTDGYPKNKCDVHDAVNINGPPKLMRRLPSPVPHDQSSTGASISFSSDFEILGFLGSGAFADVYKVRSKSDNRLYAVKRNRRQFRGKRDREMAMAEVQSMQRLQSALALRDVMSKETSYSLYLLFFYRAWQEDGYFYSQTELCCRDTCREMLDSLRLTWATAKDRYPSLVRNLSAAGSMSSGGIVPTETIWKICHDIAGGLSHIHHNGIVHQDIKPSNIFFVLNARFGAMCKIGDFGMAGDTGSSGDGLEGDARYMSPELLMSSIRHPSTDVFSFGLTIYEIASELHFEMPSDGHRWHQLRAHNEPRLSSSRGKELEVLVQSMTNPKQTTRPTADQILEHPNVKAAGRGADTFLRDYIRDVEEFDRKEAELNALDYSEEKTPRNGQRHTGVRSPSLSMLMPGPPNLFSPAAASAAKR
jgi:membrane-associated tyrosine- and threonine-specific cdc2-inhibitory kinase